MDFLICFVHWCSLLRENHNGHGPWFVPNLNVSSSCSLFPTQLDLCQSRPVPQYKNFQIEVGSQGYRLFGTETFRTSLKELLEHLQGQSLRTENLRFQLRRCCPPQPRGTSTPDHSHTTIYSQERSGTVADVKPDDLYPGRYTIADEKDVTLGTSKG